MGNPAELTLLVFPPVPLAAGQILLSEADGRPQRVRAVTLVMTTEAGDEARVSLQERHGAWWPPSARLPGA